MSESVKGATALQQELEKARESLKGVDENIRKLTGRDPAIVRPLGRRIGYDDSNRVGGGAGEIALARNSFGNSRYGGAQWSGNVRRDEEHGSGSAEPAAKRRPYPESRLSGRLGRPMQQQHPPLNRESEEEDEELPHKPAVASSVVAAVHPPPDPKARQVLMEQNATDLKGRERNKRMFGALLGTLQRFKDESKQADDREKRRQEVERKLEEKQRNERENLRRERQALFGERRRKETQMRQIQQKIYLVQQFELWEKETRKLANFIRTKTKPYVYFLPKALVAGNERQMEATKKAVDDIVSEKRRRLEADIERLMGHSEGGGGDEGAEEEEEGHEQRDDGGRDVPQRRRRGAERGRGGDDDEDDQDEEEGEIRDRPQGDAAASVARARVIQGGADGGGEQPADELIEGEHMDLAYADVARDGEGHSVSPPAPAAEGALTSGAPGVVSGNGKLANGGSHKSPAGREGEEQMEEGEIVAAAAV